jgi:hypothetical protein
MFKCWQVEKAEPTHFSGHWSSAIKGHPTISTKGLATKIDDKPLA